MGRKLSSAQRLEILNKFQVEFPTIQMFEQGWDDLHVAGSSIPSKSIVLINAEVPMDKGEYISTICHEICHIELYRSGKFHKYHQFFSEDTHVDLPAIRDHFVLYPAVESQVDRMARVLCNKLHPKIKYRYDTGEPEYQHRLFIVAQQSRLVMEAEYIEYLRGVWGV